MNFHLGLALVPLSPCRAEINQMENYVLQLNIVAENKMSKESVAEELTLVTPHWNSSNVDLSCTAKAQ